MGRDFLPEQPILMIKMFSSPTDQVLREEFRDSPVPTPAVPVPAVTSAPQPCPPDVSVHRPSGRAASSTLGPTPRMGSAGSSVARAWMLRACTGCPPPRHGPALPATRRRWALPLSAQCLHSSQRAASFLCQGHIFNSKLGFWGHRRALTLTARLALVPLSPLPPPPPPPPSLLPQLFFSYL